VVCSPHNLFEDLVDPTGRDVQALKVLESFGILTRTNTQTLRLDPIVADNFPSFVDDEDLERARTSAALAVETGFLSGQFETWIQRDRCLPLATHMIDAGRQEMFILPLLVKFVRYLTERSRFSQARKYVQSLEASIKCSNKHDTKTIEALVLLTLLKYELGLYEEAQTDAITALTASQERH
jgi:hypothetical protein